MIVVVLLMLTVCRALIMKKDCLNDEIHKSCSFYEEYTCWETQDLNKRVKTAPKRLPHCKSGCYCNLAIDIDLLMVSGNKTNRNYQVLPLTHGMLSKFSVLGERSVITLTSDFPWLGTLLNHYGVISDMVRSYPNGRCVPTMACKDLEIQALFKKIPSGFSNF